jgi:hypothetical protein
MARKTPPDRLSQLVACATRVFVAQGIAAAPRSTSGGL